MQHVSLLSSILSQINTNTNKRLTMKCKDIAEKVGKTAMEVGRTRKRLFPDCGKEVTEEEASALYDYFAESNEPSFGFCEGIVQIARPGSREIGVKIKGVKEMQRAFVPLNLETENLWLTRIKLEYINYNGKTYYRHAALSNKIWAALSRELPSIK